MELQELVAQLDGLEEDSIICAKRPWSETAEAQLVQPDEEWAVPSDVKEAGFEYVLEVHVAKELMEVFEGKPPSLAEQVRLLLHYAENDAYPDWVYRS